MAKITITKQSSSDGKPTWIVRRQDAGGYTQRHFTNEQAARTAANDMKAQLARAVAAKGPAPKVRPIT